MPQMVKIRATRAMPPGMRSRLQYHTRMLTAGDDEFEVSATEAEILRKVKWAEDVPVAPRRGRPPRAVAAAAAEERAEAPTDPYADKTVGELRAMVEATGRELDPGYIRREVLISMLGADAT